MQTNSWPSSTRLGYFLVFKVSASEDLVSSRTCTWKLKFNLTDLHLALASELFIQTLLYGKLVQQCIRNEEFLLKDMGQYLLKI
ncbi:hypothetical protein BpHYR1_033095 [Brachionus plicatilis]|uniref:Uncharacterized protein n=1 Tax=Brachionus plicatilis TaxID=10195 RepID=A0A3M7Q092_BRAPC|nr:hypothetical protein BpHYR1_033095 [Brachionus plicatilis]